MELRRPPFRASSSPPDPPSTFLHRLDPALLQATAASVTWSRCRVGSTYSAAPPPYLVFISPCLCLSSSHRQRSLTELRRRRSVAGHLSHHLATVNKSSPPPSPISIIFVSLEPPPRTGDLPSSALYRNRLSISKVQSPSLLNRRRSSVAVLSFDRPTQNRGSISTLASSPLSATFVRQVRSRGSVANNPPPFLSVFRWISHPSDSATYHHRYSSWFLD
ncbi:hypothetical protein PIB30_086203 [Stylosanthes scabra]|uniref:Uncharacterized protein n=1 Tax=Stylosanthes scabra TaxID=79078 RepID=A0ABU6ZRM8_9FABA|nr:hypothetical protein [Stylosanthes scabra]